jgi:RimJ/RimL family protein N-acetyltransferase
MTLEEFDALVWSTGAMHHAIVRSDTRQPLGMVKILRDDLRSGTAEVGMFVDHRLWRAGWPLEGIVLFVDRLFGGFDYRKLYFLISSSSLARVAGALDNWLIKEAVLADQIRVGDHYEDLNFLTLHRSRWLEWSTPPETEECR